MNHKRDLRVVSHKKLKEFCEKKDYEDSRIALETSLNLLNKFYSSKVYIILFWECLFQDYPCTQHYRYHWCGLSDTLWQSI